MYTMRTLAAAGALALLGLPADAIAQSGAGSTGAPTLQLVAGGRASALAGAYTAATGDADVVFYNPAGAGSLRAGASLGYHRLVEDVSLGSAAGALRIGRIALGIGIVALDAGDIEVLEPDPAFGGQRGMPTGEIASMRESAVRLAAALPLLGDRLRIGAAAGYVATEIAGASQGAPLFDLGAQLQLSRATLGAALRNMGGALSGGALAESDLPTELAVGGAFEIAGPRGLGAQLSADLRTRLNEGGTGLAAAVEAGMLPGGASRFGAVARLGYSTDGGEGALLAPLGIGAGVVLGDLAVDYTYQDVDFFGAVHRIGVRWARMP